MNQRPAYELTYALLAGFRTIIDEVHEDLAANGHPGLRPAYGFAMQAIDSGATASVIAARLGVSKQAAGKTVSRLEELGYVERTPNPRDARQKLVTPTERGIDMILKSAAAMEKARARWAAQIGAERLAQLEADLQTVARPTAYRLDLARWAND